MQAKNFETHARDIRVIYHIIPQIRKERLTPIDSDHKQWTTFDSIEQQIHSTISFDLLVNVREKRSTTTNNWNCLTITFQDNQNSYVYALEQDLSSTCMNDFSNVFAYRQRLK